MVFYWSSSCPPLNPLITFLCSKCSCSPYSFLPWARRERIEKGEVEDMLWVCSLKSSQASYSSDPVLLRAHCPQPWGTWAAGVPCSLLLPVILGLAPDKENSFEMAFHIFAVCILSTWHWLWYAKVATDSEKNRFILRELHHYFLTLMLFSSTKGLKIGTLAVVYEQYVSIGYLGVCGLVSHTSSGIQVCLRKHWDIT